MQEETQQTNRLTKGICRVGDILWLSILMAVFSLPVLTAGAAMSAAYSVVFSWQRCDIPETTSVFIGAFKENLAGSTAIWAICLAMLLAATAVLNVCAAGTHPLQRWLSAAAVVLLAVTIVLVLLVFAIQAGFETNMAQTFANALYLMLKHTWSVLAVTATTIAATAAALTVMPPLLVVLGGLTTYLNGRVLRNVFDTIIESKETP